MARVGSVFYAVSAPGRPLRLDAVKQLNRRVAKRIAAALVPAVITAPSIGGVPQSGKALTANGGSWTNDRTSFAFQWERCDANGSTCAPITGATTGTYTVTDADIGSTLRAGIAAANGAAKSKLVMTDATPVITPASAPAPAALTKPTTVARLAVCPESDLVDDDGISTCKKDWSAGGVHFGTIYCTFGVIDGVGSNVVIEFFAASKPVYSWNAGLVTYRELFVWYSENLSPGPHVCRVSVGGVVAEKAFVVGTT